MSMKYLHVLAACALLALVLLAFPTAAQSQEYAGADNTPTVVAVCQSPADMPLDVLL